MNGIETRNTAEAATNFLIEEILAGRIPAGTVIRHKSCPGRSAIEVAQAVEVLRAQGLVVGRANRPAIVRTFLKEEMSPIAHAAAALTLAASDLVPDVHVAKIEFTSERSEVPPGATQRLTYMRDIAKACPSPDLKRLLTQALNLYQLAHLQYPWP